MCVWTGPGAISLFYCVFALYIIRSGGTYAEIRQKLPAEITAKQAPARTEPAGNVVFAGNPCSDMTFEKDSYWRILRNQLERV